MTEAPPEPVAQGDLAKTPFAHVLLHVHQKAMTGTVVVWPGAEGAKGQDRIFIEAGWPVAGRLVDRAAALDRGMLPLFARKDGPYAFYEVDLVGDAPLKGRVDPYMIFAASLRGSTRDDMVDAYLESLGPDGIVRFKAGSDVKRYLLQPKEAAFVDVIRAAPASVAELLAQCELGPQMGRRILYMLLATRAIERFEAASVPVQAPRPSTQPAPRVSMPMAAPAAGAPMDLPLPEMPVPEAAPPAAPPPPESPPAAPPRASMPGRPSMPMQADRATVARFKSSMAVPPPPPAGLSADANAFWIEVTERCRVIDQQNYYDMLAVPRDTGEEAVRKAYFALAKRWHPDRSTGELAPLRPYLEQVFGFFTAAHDTLADEKKRGQYIRTVQEGGGTPEADRKLEAILWAAKEHQKAEVMIRQRNFEAAAALLSAAIEIVPDEADLLATWAWCVFNLPGSDKRMQEMFTAVDRALALEPKHDRALYYKGMLLQRQGKDAEALASFKRAVEVNKKNADAIREVRLAEMRQGKGGGSKPSGTTGKPAEGGIFSKLFGGGKKS